MSQELKDRTKAYALRVVRLVDSLPPKASAQHMGHQLLRAGTSVAANYRAACRGRSPAEFCAKLGIVEEEADESVFWMELLIEGGFVRQDRLAPLIKEGEEILAITIASIKTARASK